MSYLFYAAAILGTTSWFVAVAEYIAFACLLPSSFRVGVTVFRRHLSFISDLPLPSERGVHATANAKYRVAAPRLVVLRAKMRFLQVQTPFPIKCIITISDGEASVVGRLPVGTSLFMLAWLAAWLPGSLATHDRFAVQMALLGVLFVAFMVGSSVPIELRRARASYLEVWHTLTTSGVA